MRDTSPPAYVIAACHTPGATVAGSTSRRPTGCRALDAL